MLNLYDVHLQYTKAPNISSATNANCLSTVSILFSQYSFKFLIVELLFSNNFVIGFCGTVSTSNS